MYIILKVECFDILIENEKKKKKDYSPKDGFFTILGSNKTFLHP